MPPALALEVRVSFLLYAIGFVVFVTGLASMAAAVGVSQAYILAGAGVLFGAGLLTAVARLRVKAPA